METRTIRQQVTFKAPPHEVYELLMDEKKHAAFSQSKTTVSRKVGGKVSSGDGYIEAVNLELVPDEKIVQQWRDTDWPEGHFSKATWTFTPIASGTRLLSPRAACRRTSMTLPPRAGATITGNL